MKTGVTTPQNPLPIPEGDEAAAADRLKQLVDRFQSSTGELRPSPFFGALTRQQSNDLHLIHCAHHLSFLLPLRPSRDE